MKTTESNSEPNPELNPELKPKTYYLSDHFSLFELTKSQTALRLGLSNSPNKEAISALKAVCHGILEPVRKQFKRPFSPLSGYRSTSVNKAVGGSKKSQHMTGQAVDIELVGVDNYALAKWIVDSLTFDQLVLEYYVAGIPTSGWVHVSFLPISQGGKKAYRKNRHQVLSKGPDGFCYGLKG